MADNPGLSPSDSADHTKLCTFCGRTYPEESAFCASDGNELTSMASEPQDRLIGQTLDERWVIERKIDSGNMGTVYEASQLSVDRRVAVKTLKAIHADNDELAKRFLHEAKVASTISHPNVVTIFDFGQANDGTLYLAMEFLEGRSLAQRLEAGSLSVREIIEITSQILSGLAAAHSLRIIHRDLKPANIYLVDMPDGGIHVKILDFGIAKALDSKVNLTTAGELFGTPWYMSPEQCLGQTIDGRSDLYAVGCILYELLVGRPPFNADSPMAVLAAHVHEAPRAIHEAAHRRDIPAELARLCMQLLEKSPGQRPPDASATLFAMKNIADNAAHARAQTTSGPPIAAAAPYPTQQAAPAPSEPNLSQGPHSAHAGETWGTSGLEYETSQYTYSTSHGAAPDLPIPRPMPIIWMLTLGLVAAIISVGTVATIWTWLAAGSPDLLMP